MKGSKMCLERQKQAPKSGFFTRFKKDLMVRFKGFDEKTKQEYQKPVNGFRLSTLKRK
jgi:hypothetical protein